MKDVSNCKNDSRSFVFDKIYEDIFVYGHQVEDFLALDKEQLFTLHHGAILSLDSQQETNTDKIANLERENRDLKEEVNILNNKVTDLETQLALIKAHLGI